MGKRDFVVSIVVAGVVCLLFCCEVGVGELGDPNSMARDPYPSEGETNVATEPNLTLSWSPGDIEDGFFTEVGYHVHVDINEANVVGADPLWGDGEFTEETSYTIENLEPETEYFWRIDTKLWSMRPPHTSFMIPGEVWSFRTMPKKAWGPEPADGAEDVGGDPNVTLSWKPGDFDPRVFFINNPCYHVYYGTDSGEVSSGWQGYLETYADSSVQIGPLMQRTTYYWRIDTNLGSPRPPHIIYKFEGDVWSFTTAPGPPRVITVDDDGPADFSTIQAAIDDSYDGDTVLVADGTYTGDGNRDIDFHGKAITLKSENGAAACIIDCNGTEDEPHRGFHFHSGEDANSAIIGFTITKGYADIGGGIVCDGAGPSIIDCVITQNTAYLETGWNVEGGRGGGIHCNDASPSVIDCLITHNVAYEYYDAGYGGGIYCDDSNALITGCTIRNNEARCRAAEIVVGGHGGGIYSEDGNIIVAKCVIENNSKNMGWSGAIHCLGGFSTIDGCEISENDENFSLASAIRLNYCRAVVRNCTIRGSGGSGIFCDDVSDGSISGCTIMGNSGSGIRALASNLTISSCIIAENSFFGIDSTMSTLEIRHCTVAWNEMSGICPYISCRAVRCEGECSFTIIGSILWFRQTEPWPWSSDYPSLYCNDAEVRYSCIHGWDGALGGVGNIGEYPMFADPGHWDDPCNTPEQSWDDVWVKGDYHLKSQGGRWGPNDGGWTTDDMTSPCVDGGDPVTPIGLEPFANGGIINMGAYGGTAEASKSYFGEPPCETAMAGDVNGDCVVDYRDFQFMALHWLE